MFAGPQDLVGTFVPCRALQPWHVFVGALQITQFLSFSRKKKKKKSKTEVNGRHRAECCCEVPEQTT